MIKNESMPPAIANSDEMLLKAGQYCRHADDTTGGMKYADKLLQKNSNSIDGLSLKGDLQLLNNAYSPALELYKKALEEYYRQNGNRAEPPEYLLAMIEFAKKIGQ
jgi:tetratricopeptide (TPR) repeat protein